MKYKCSYNTILEEFKTFEDLKNAIATEITEKKGKIGIVFDILKCKDTKELKNLLTLIEKRLKLKFEIL